MDGVVEKFPGRISVDIHLLASAISEPAKELPLVFSVSAPHPFRRLGGVQLCTLVPRRSTNPYRDYLLHHSIIVK